MKSPVAVFVGPAEHSEATPANTFMEVRHNLLDVINNIFRVASPIRQRRA